MRLRLVLATAGLASMLALGAAAPVSAAQPAEETRATASSKAAGDRGSCSSPSARASALKAGSVGYRADARSVRDCSPGMGWTYIQSFFWGSDCHAAGTRGRDGGYWQQYKCMCGNAVTNYELWVK